MNTIFINSQYETILRLLQENNKELIIMNEWSILNWINIISVLIALGGVLITFFMMKKQFKQMQEQYKITMVQMQETSYATSKTLDKMTDITEQIKRHITTTWTNHLINTYLEAIKADANLLITEIKYASNEAIANITRGKNVSKEQTMYENNIIKNALLMKNMVTNFPKNDNSIIKEEVIISALQEIEESIQLHKKDLISGGLDIEGKISIKTWLNSIEKNIQILSDKLIDAKY